MTQKWTRVSRRMLFTWCLLGGLICLFAPVSLTSKLQLAYTQVFSWPLEAGHSLSLASRTLSPVRDVNSPGNGRTAAEYQRLRNQIDNLEAQLRESRQEIDGLSHMRVVAQWERMTFLPADVRLNDQTQDVLFINRGTRDRVAVGQYVMADMSIIGTVSHVSSQSAKVKLITDEDSEIPVIIGESDLARVMKGGRGDVAKIPYVPASHPVTKGTRVYAGKTPGLLDVPIVAGQVKQCRIDPENPSVLDITVEPLCEITGLTSVVVILSAPQP